jgi:hypothetical protein
LLAFAFTATDKDLPKEFCGHAEEASVPSTFAIAHRDGLEIQNRERPFWSLTNMFSSSGRATD